MFVVIDACSLQGAGVDGDPWRVGLGEDPQVDFELVGTTQTSDDDSNGYIDSCVLSGHYLQSADIRDVDESSDGDLVVDGIFTGTCDGDHYAISYYSGGRDGAYAGRSPLFEELGPGGVIKRLRLTGNMKTTTTDSSSLVQYLYGGTLSEIDSSVWIEIDDSDAVAGGLAAHSGGTSGSGGSGAVNQNAFIQYSKFDGRIDWIDNWIADEPEVEGPTIGGLVGMASGTGVTEIRDSYSRAAISYDSGDLTGSNASTAVFAGGLVGSDGFYDLDLDNGVTSSDAKVRLLRTYFAGSFSNTCEADECYLDHVFTGGLIGWSTDYSAGESSGDLFVSNFWLSTAASQAVGKINDAGGQPMDYTVADGGLPEADPALATTLRTKSTFESKAGESGSGLPSGDSDLAELASTGSLAEQDYRWAIEQGNVWTFVASNYTSESSYRTRQLYSDTSVEQSYRREGAGDLTVHDGDDPENVTGYPELGRVWEICSNSNDGYPFLVWEELDCSGGGSGGRSNDDDDAAAQAAALGLTEAEYAEVLASGLTFEQFLAARLAATGVSLPAILLGGIASVILLGVGGWRMATQRPSRIRV